MSDQHLPQPPPFETAGHSSATETRPGTAGSATPSDPFNTPLSSRTPSVRHQPPSPSSSKVSFPEFLSGPRKSYITAQQHAYSTRSSVRGTTTSQGPKTKMPRMKSHLLPPDTTIPKPWKEGKNHRATFSYWIVYFFVSIGLAAGALQCYWEYSRVPLDKKPLCLVFQENFDNEDAVFGPNGTFFREVSMNGFG